MNEEIIYVKFGTPIRLDSVPKEGVNLLQAEDQHIQLSYDEKGNLVIFSPKESVSGFKFKHVIHPSNIADTWIKVKEDKIGSRKTTHS